MLAILAITAPIFILIGIGFLACRSQLVSREQAAGMGRFVITFALPALVIKALLERPLDEVLNWNYLLAFASGSLASFAIGYLVARRLRGDSLSGSALTGLGSAVSNSGFVGYPIVAMVVGPPAGVALALGMMVENLLMIPLALTLAELGRQREASVWQALGGTLASLMRHPVLIAISLGLGMALLDVRPPPVLMRVIEMLALASAPVALFVIGASLNGLKVGTLYGDMLQLSASKLLLHPLLVMGGFLLFPVADPQLRLAGILMACAPMMSIFPILGARYGLEGRCAAALVSATVLSFLSISLFLWLLH
ncbi:AEC family transporter [Pseudomonas oligotrophica]|uniref:AEC family transporter n=1 Tax=Pseudomonas oligotrophica TaxID=2912055 RepID=UPI001F2D4E2E|nr:AEC family transporter [Pseudomonas oligotrophica]MCF7203507.1 AEC family transporter [Pseudomonas oligotrophica]